MHGCICECVESRLLTACTYVCVSLSALMCVWLQLKCMCASRWSFINLKEWSITSLPVFTLPVFNDWLPGSAAWSQHSVNIHVLLVCYTHVTHFYSLYPPLRVPSIHLPWSMNNTSTILSCHQFHEHKYFQLQCGSLRSKWFTALLLTINLLHLFFKPQLCVQYCWSLQGIYYQP